MTAQCQPTTGQDRTSQQLKRLHLHLPVYARWTGRVHRVVACGRHADVQDAVPHTLRLACSFDTSCCHCRAGGAQQQLGVARPAGNLSNICKAAALQDHTAEVLWQLVQADLGREPDLPRTCRKLVATRPHTCCSSVHESGAWAQAAGRHADTCIDAGVVNASCTACLTLAATSCMSAACCTSRGRCSSC